MVLYNTRGVWDYLSRIKKRAFECSKYYNNATQMFFPETSSPFLLYYYPTASLSSLYLSLSVRPQLDSEDRFPQDQTRYFVVLLSLPISVSRFLIFQLGCVISVDSSPKLPRSISSFFRLHTRLPQADPFFRYTLKTKQVIRALN